MAKKSNKDNEREQRRELALIRLQNPFYRGLTAAKWGTWQEYGKLAEGVREATIQGYSNGMDNEHAMAYRELIEPRLMADNSLQENANELMITSLTDITIQDVFELMDSQRSPKKSYSTKYVSNLNEEEQKAVVRAYIGNLTDSVVAETLGARISNRLGGLEEVFAEKLKSKKR